MAKMPPQPRLVYQIVLHPRAAFVTTRTRTVAEGIERLDGRRADGTWAVVEWSIAKTLARNEKGQLVTDDLNAAALLEELGPLKHVRGDRFKVREA
jgi:hypothetical protein